MFRLEKQNFTCVPGAEKLPFSFPGKGKTVKSPLSASLCILGQMIPHFSPTIVINHSSAVRCRILFTYAQHHLFN
jgi:hypothetical protein